MHIPASKIGEYLHPDIEVRVLTVDGQPWKVLGPSMVQALIDQQCISGGVGSHTKLRYVTLNAASDVAEMEMHRQERANSVRGRLQHSQASQTCVADRWSNHIGTVTVYRQVRSWAFGHAERLRQDRYDAGNPQLATA